MTKEQASRELAAFITSLPDNSNVEVQADWGMHIKSLGDGSVEGSPNQTATLTIKVNGGARETRES